MANDGIVNITAGVGTPVDVSAITRGDIAGTVVDRQRVAIGDDRGNLLSLRTGEVPTADAAARSELEDIASSLRQITFILSKWTGIEPVDLGG